MRVNTKRVVGRRLVRYDSLADLLDDAKRLSQVEVRSLGNWSPGQVYEHLARSLDASIDGMDFSLPAPARWLMTLLMKKKFLKEKLPPGFKSSAAFVPSETTTEAGLVSLERAVLRQQQESSRAPHPAFGRIGRDGWTEFHLRHAEMHMSFLHDGEGASR